MRDLGVFADLDAQVQIGLPSGLDPKRLRAVVDRARSQLVLYDADWPLKAYPLGGPTELHVGTTVLALRPGDAHELRPLLRRDRLISFDRAVELPPGDYDNDGLPDPLDVLIGAHKAALNADRYDGRYVHIGYPSGDVPRDIGVCTDVIVRSLRNAGYDLQRLVHEDVRRSPSAYPTISRANSDIDHRRVKSLLPFFQRSFDARSASLNDSADPLRPGDVIFMDTFPNRPGSEHVGIIADAVSGNARPLVINNWDVGTVTKPMDLLAFVPVTARFRLPARVPDRGPIAALRTQLLTVVSERWDATRATVRRYEREPGRAFRAVGGALHAELAAAGYGWSDGLHGPGAPAGQPGPVRGDGDGRTPAGVFELDELDLSQSGGCALVHASAQGCTRLSESDLRELNAWLQPSAAVLVALPASAYARVQRSWGLP